MYGGIIKCPKCGYDFCCETIYTSIDCPSCGEIINLEPLPDAPVEAADATVEAEG